MLPAYSLPFQPYFVFPNLLSSGNSIIYHNNSPFLIQSFLPQASFNTSNSNQNVFTPTSTDSQPQFHPFFKVQGLNQPQNQDLQKTQNRTVKEKAIKKVANRPATYLTQRKFYLAQSLSQENNLQRVLRPRYQKKRSTKLKEASPLAKQQKDCPLKPRIRDFKSEEVTLKDELTYSKEKQSDAARLKEEHEQQRQLFEEQLAEEGAEVEAFFKSGTTQ